MKPFSSRTTDQSPRPCVMPVFIMAALFQVFLAQRTAHVPDTERKIITFPSISHSDFTLANGLRVVVHEDHKAPVVAVSLVYLVGSGDEQEGKTGLAHLYEHLLFSGSEHAPGRWFARTAPLGLTDDVAYTHSDFTRLGGTVPTISLDQYLWIEADRMAHFLPSLTQQKLDTERGVIENEYRQILNQPFGESQQLIFKYSYSAGYPYDHDPIGSMTELEHFTLEDVKDWFSHRYGPNHAVLVLAGDVDPQSARSKVQRYFGSIPPTEPNARVERWVESPPSDREVAIAANVPQARIYRVWSVPGFSTPDYDYLELFAAIASKGMRESLSKAGMTSGVNVYLSPRRLSSSFTIQADVPAVFGNRLPEVENRLDEALRDELSQVAEEKQLAEVMEAWKTAYLREIERLGGYGGKADKLGYSITFSGSPDDYMVHLQRMVAVSPEDVASAAKKWLSRSSLHLQFRPIAQLKAEGASPGEMPPGSHEFPASGFPNVQERALQNGLRVLLAKRQSGTLIEAHLVIRAGISAEPQQSRGITQILLSSIQRGSSLHPLATLGRQLNALNARLDSAINLDYSSLKLSTSRESLDKGLALLADVVLHPDLSPAHIEESKKDLLTQISQEKVAPRFIVRRAAPFLLYGEKHPYSAPLTGSGLAADVEGLDMERVRAYHSRWFRPGSATLVVAGPISMADLLRSAQAAFGGWPTGDSPGVSLPDTPRQSDRPRFFIVNKAGSTQCDISVMYSTPAEHDLDDAVMEVTSRIIAGDANSRISKVLREEKHWAYFTAVFRQNSNGPEPFVLRLPVQADKIKESIVEIQTQLEQVIERPVSESELNLARRTVAFSLPGNWELTSNVADSLDEVAGLRLDRDYWGQYSARLQQISVAEVQAAIQKMGISSRPVWLLIGDTGKIAAALRELGITDPAVYEVP